MPYTLTIGAIRCHILNDGLHPVDGGAFFGVVPRVLWERVIQPNRDNMIPSDTRSLLIETAAGLILVDTGNGDKLSPKERKRLGFEGRTNRLVRELRKVGFGPEAVNIVLLTHLHGDHAGGATRWATEDGRPGPLVATFPNARYLCQRLDLAEASFPNERTFATYHTENWQPLLANRQLEVVDGPQRIDAHVRTEIASGHTAALQMVWVEDAGESLLFLSDACNWAAHLNRLAWVPAFDLDPLQSMETKRRIRQEAFERNTLLVFQHDAQVVTGRLIEGERGPEVLPEIREEAWVDSSKEL